MFKACPKCGKIHKQGFKCEAGRDYKESAERKLRNKYVWAQMSKDIREKAQGLCEACRAKGVYTYNGLEVHHIVKLRDNPSGLLDQYNLVCLCTECHKKADRGEIDMDYLRELARGREENTPPAL